MSEPSVVGLDVGGANLKFCGTDATAYATAFAMWQRPQDLTREIAAGLSRFGDFDALAVTMTGELADCFADREIGVEHIVDHVVQAASRLGIDRVAFYGVDGRFHTIDNAKSNVDIIAAANWHALASFVASEFAGNGTLVDIGSTTTDIIRLRDGRVGTSARTDHDRLVEGSLVYVGCRRTPVCALVDSLEFRGLTCRVMNEVFATIDDARLLLESEPEDQSDCDTADGNPRTRQYAANRLARMIGLDRRSVSVGDTRELAEQVVASARGKIGRALGKARTLVISGHGRDLLPLLPDEAVVDLSHKLGPNAARCAPSYAIAVLYQAELNRMLNRCDV